MADDVKSGSSGSFIATFFSELISSPINLALLGVCGFLLYKIIAGQKKPAPVPPREPELPKLKKQDMTLEQLREYDGKGPDGRTLLACNGKVFDVTRGKRFYGPGGPYALFAGRDASRALATFSMSDDVFRNEYDDLTDLTSMQMESVREWEMQFTDDVFRNEYDDLTDLISMQTESFREWEMQITEKYEYVGRLLKPGEQPRDYSEDEDEQSGEQKNKTDGEKKTD